MPEFIPYPIDKRLRSPLPILGKPYEIVKNVPLPSRQGGKKDGVVADRPRALISDRLSSMEVGDAMLVPDYQMTVQGAAGYAHNVGYRTGGRFATRVVKGGTGIWRIA